MENESGSPLFIFALIVLFVVVKSMLRGRKDKKIMTHGEPYIGLEIEWPKSHSGKILFEGRSLLEFPLNTHNDNILHLNERSHEDKVTYAIDDQSLLEREDLSFTIEFDRKPDQPLQPQGKMPELELELMILFIQDKDKYARRELSERDTYLESTGVREIKFTNLQSRLARYTKFFQNSSQHTPNNNETIQR